MRGPHFHGGGFGLMPMVGGLLMLLALAGIAFLVVWMLQKRKALGPNFLQPPAPPAPPANDPLAILDERLARGDIDVEDYRARRSALLDGGLPRNPTTEPPPPPPEG